MKKEYTAPTALSRAYAYYKHISTSDNIVESPDLDDDDNWIKNPDPF